MLQGCLTFLASLGHTGRRVVLGHTLNAQKLMKTTTKKSHVLSKFTILCWAAFMAIPGYMRPAGCRLDGHRVTLSQAVGMCGYSTCGPVFIKYDKQQLSSFMCKTLCSKPKIYKKEQISLSPASFFTSNQQCSALMYFICFRANSVYYLASNI